MKVNKGTRVALLGDVDKPAYRRQALFIGHFGDNAASWTILTAVNISGGVSGENIQRQYNVDIPDISRNDRASSKLLRQVGNYRTLSRVSK
jgi:hypothetical protein